MLDNPISKVFGKNVFNDSVMQKRLPAKIYNELKKTIEQGKELTSSLADVIAHEMKEWAIENGATHYTHWFQPLTGATAEKHDSFISVVLDSGKVLMHFSGKELIKGEPDASSFPSGGLRATFEARGYTAWDCTSPAFIRKDALGATLVIPTAFCSYKGDALDEKTPLLRSMQAINKVTLRLLRLLGNGTAKRVKVSVGAEQEYFIIDREKYLKRKDLIYTGRTLFGAKPPKGQEMDDHYFGAIKERIGAFMKDVNEELWSLGVTSKTQHNEAAPAQHELAIIYSEANVATDHNQIVMETLKKVAVRHNLQCLLHEKPFLGVNGSGKHNNWSLITDDGINLLEPGKTPHENRQFLLILSCVLRAVNLHGDIIRQSAAVLGNDLRLGTAEAPPAIISVFLGDQLRDVVEQLIEKGAATHSLKGKKLVTGVSTLPDFSVDATDRNRTSPFAFTGNKFEFRMVGSSDSIARANTALNTIVAESFEAACEFIENSENKEEAIQTVIVENFKNNSKIIFDGNGYDASWIEEAKRRGLPNIDCTVKAIAALEKEENIRLFEKYLVMSENELKSRAEIEYEKYAKTVNIEARSSINIVTKQLLPAVISYTHALADTANSVAKLGIEPVVQRKLLKDINNLLIKASDMLDELKEHTEDAASIANMKDRAFYFRNNVVGRMEALRGYVDSLELLVDKKYWPMPSYGDILFEV